MSFVTAIGMLRPFCGEMSIMAKKPTAIIISIAKLEKSIPFSVEKTRVKLATERVKTTIATIVFELFFSSANPFLFLNNHNNKYYAIKQQPKPIFPIIIHKY